jgi:hypothetical protein
MDKNICLQFFGISSALPPVYTHPYHKLSIPKPRFKSLTVKEKIRKLKETNMTEESEIKTNKNYKSAVPKVKISIVKKLYYRSPRPLTCKEESPKVFLDMSYQMFTPKFNENKKFFNSRGFSL